MNLWRHWQAFHSLEWLRHVPSYEKLGSGDDEPVCMNAPSVSGDSWSKGLLTAPATAPGETPFSCANWLTAGTLETSNSFTFLKSNNSNACRAKLPQLTSWSN